MRCATILSLSLTFISATTAFAQNSPPRNLILFVPDGLRALKVTPETAPAMSTVRDKGVNFRNSHSLFPTFTMANASGMASGHYLGDTGVFSNSIYTGHPTPVQNNSPIPFIEHDQVLGDLDEQFNGDYLNEETLLKAARKAGYSTAAIGKVGPTLMFDHTERTGKETITIDDQTGGIDKAGKLLGIPLSDEMKDALAKAGLAVETPGRGDNGKAGDAKTPGTTEANIKQQAYMADVASKVVLPMFKARNKPFVLIFWSRDPDGTQHNQGDSLNKVTPGINGPSSLASIKNADDNLAQLRKTLDDLGLSANTNIMISADHGFSTISKESKTSATIKGTYADTPEGFLPLGFLAIDLAKSLDLPLFDPNDKFAAVADNAYPKAGNAYIGKDKDKPELIIATNGGSDLIYLPTGDKDLAGRTVKALLKQDYISGIFVEDSLGSFPGALPLSSINLSGKAVTPHPAIVVSFRSYSEGCEEPAACQVEVADTVLRQGQGMHGSFGRGDTHNFMAAIGPDFKAGFVDPLPVSNADTGMTAAHLLGLKRESKGSLIGRVMSEATVTGETPTATTDVMRSAPDDQGLVTVLQLQKVGEHKYFDVAGFPGRTVGLDAK
ncbi:alkaline phosphatase family protein [Tardiphaga robiniae]|uniref:Alkaline phosphatase family protein n=1 Tax=Tardiphaga robiniae TaxID=943830 RepID=A0A7G6TVF8_9BRAD|nr:alkaline phosphatase family protein [Tardiphaga robiniae]QND70740.1 alkaline phosphatase family protein [Tardiphaga robiniae]